MEVGTPCLAAPQTGAPCCPPLTSPDKGTTAWHGISAAGAVFPSASVNGQARCIALTPFVPLSREAGEGERAAGRTAARSHTPLPQRGRGAGGEGKKCAPPAHSEPKRCTLISLTSLSRTRARGESCRAHCRAPLHPRPRIARHFLKTPSVRSDKGTTVRHEVFEAGAIFPSASVNRQVRCIALTPFVPLSRLRERGNALQGALPRAPTPLSHSVGEGLGVRAKKRARLAHSELKRCTLISYTPLPRCGRGAGGEGKKACAPRARRT
jgi:hypothetical protein